MAYSEMLGVGEADSKIMLRSWQICFLLTAIVFGLQLFPLTGMPLMILAAPYWSAILINLGFALMARDAWREPDLRWLMIFPLLWFSGYLAATSISHWRAYRYITEIAAANANQHITFDPSRQDVVIESNRTDEAVGGGLRADTLVDDFGLNRAYQRVMDGRGGYRSYSLIAMICPLPKVRKNDDGTATIYRQPVDIQGHHVSRARDLCIVQDSQPPEKPTVRIGLQPQAGRYGDSRVSQNIVIDTPNGATAMLRSGWARPLAWLPQPIIGCALNSGAPAWRCFAGFKRQTDLTSQSALQVIVQALGLNKITIRERSSNANWS